MEIECPCIDCITLAICKAVMRDNYGIYATLSRRCSIFKDHYSLVYLSLDNPEGLVVLKLFPTRYASHRK